MILKKISLHNIRSYEDEEITFPLGSTLLAGDIGTGKTSVLLAIEFALFGLQPGQKGSSLLRNGKNTGKVNLEIAIDDKNIVIERQLERKKSVTQSSAKIIINGQEKEISLTELKDKILYLLQYPREFAKKINFLYRFTVYTPQEEMKQIVLEPAESRLNTLRYIFGIDKYKTIRENTELFTFKLRELSRFYEGQIKDLDDIRKKLQEKKENSLNLEKDIEKLKIELEIRRKETEKKVNEKKEVEGKIKEKEKYDKEAEKTNVMLISKKEFLLEIEKEIGILEREVEDAKKIKFDLEEIGKKIEEKEEKEKAIEEKNKEYIELLSKIKSLNSKIYEAEKLKEQISSLELCPTCLQNVNKDYKLNIIRKKEEEIFTTKKEISNFEKEKEIITENLEILNSAFKKINKELEELNLLKMKFSNIKEKELKIENLKKQKNSNEKDISLLEGQILNLKESASLLKKYETIYQEKEIALKEAENREKEKEIELASKEKEKELILIIIDEIEKEISNKEKLKNKLLEINELEDWLSSSFLSLISVTERNIMLKLREEFSKLFNEWFNILVPEIFSVHLDEDFTPVIEQQDYSLDYSFLSGGERTAIALAYRLALNQVINSLLSKIKTRDLIILDEPTDGFSEQQLDKIRDVLNQLKVQQLIIVSHESKIESFVENIIRFKKEAGITKIEM